MPSPAAVEPRRRRSRSGRSPRCLESQLTRAGALALPAVVAVGCALAEPPPGAHPDTRPPEVEAIVPGRDTVAPGFSDDVRIRFDEPVRVGAELQRELIASPAYRYRVTTGFSDIRIRPQEEWREGVVYCFEIPAGITDLLGNRTQEPIDFCFSTGPPVTETEVTGTLLDRVTGQPISDAGRVLFYPVDGDSIPYTAVVRREGDFRLRSLPPGAYLAYGFVDRNRNLRLDRRLEPYDSATVVLEDPRARQTLTFRAVEPDTTPPVLRRARAVDSLTLRLEFDDPLPREQPDARVTVVEEETGRRWPVRAVGVGEPERGELSDPEIEAEAPVPQTEPGETREPEAEAEETAPPETEPADGMEIEPAALPPAVRARGPVAEELPDVAVTVQLREPLVPGRYRVEALDFRNLRGLVGGGELTFEHPAPQGTPVRPRGDPR